MNYLESCSSTQIDCRNRKSNISLIDRKSFSNLFNIELKRCCYQQKFRNKLMEKGDKSKITVAEQLQKVSCFNVRQQGSKRGKKLKIYIVTLERSKTEENSFILSSLMSNLSLNDFIHRPCCSKRPRVTFNH